MSNRTPVRARLYTYDTVFFFAGALAELEEAEAVAGAASVGPLGTVCASPAAAVPAPALSKN